MGAWGYSLFQSDHDFDMICNLEGEAGIRKFMEDSGLKTEDGYRYYDQDGNEVHYSLYGRMCTSTELLKDYMDSGVLVNMLTKYANETPLTFPSSGRVTYHEQGYTFVLLCACAQTLGCHISTEFTDKLRNCYRHVGLMRDALVQVERALNTYKNGEKFDFGSLGLVETANMRSTTRNQPSNPGEVFGMNVQSPGPFGDFFQMMSENMMRNRTNPAGNQTASNTHKASNGRKDSAVRFGVNECGGCGAHQRDSGDPLVWCGKCKSQKYCSVKCQKKDWKAHKTTCRAPPSV